MQHTGSDDELMRLAGEGDRAAFSRLVAGHMRRATAIAARITRNAGDAEELVQEAFLKVWLKAPEWQTRDEGGGAAFSTWFYRVLVNLCIDRMRKPKNAPLEEASKSSTRRPTPSTTRPPARPASASRPPSRPCPTASAPRSCCAITKASPTSRPPPCWRSASVRSNPCWCARAARCATPLSTLPLKDHGHDHRPLPRYSRRLRRRPRALAGVRTRGACRI